MVRDLFFERVANRRNGERKGQTVGGVRFGERWEAKVLKGIAPRLSWFDSVERQDASRKTAPSQDGGQHGGEAPRGVEVTFARVTPQGVVRTSGILEPGG